MYGLVEANEFVIIGNPETNCRFQDSPEAQSDDKGVDQHHPVGKDLLDEQSDATTLEEPFVEIARGSPNCCGAPTPSGAQAAGTLSSG